MVRFDCIHCGRDLTSTVVKTLIKNAGQPTTTSEDCPACGRKNHWTLEYSIVLTKAVPLTLPTSTADKDRLPKSGNIHV